MHDLVHSCNHWTRLPVVTIVGMSRCTVTCPLLQIYIVGEPKNSKGNRSWRKLCGWMSSDQLSHDFSDLVDFQPNWNTSSFVRSFAIISLLCCSNHLFERNRYQDIDTYRLQMKFGLRLRESWLTICCAIHKILLFIRIGDGDITPMRSSKWIKVNSIQRLFVYQNLLFLIPELCESISVGDFDKVYHLPVFI